MIETDRIFKGFQEIEIQQISRMVEWSKFKKMIEINQNLKNLLNVQNLSRFTKFLKWSKITIFINDK